MNTGYVHIKMHEEQSEAELKYNFSFQFFFNLSKKDR